jgi:hypothetical protein
MHQAIAISVEELVIKITSEAIHYALAKVPVRKKITPFRKTIWVAAAAPVLVAVSTLVNL